MVNVGGNRVDSNPGAARPEDGAGLSLGGLSGVDPFGDGVDLEGDRAAASVGSLPSRGRLADEPLDLTGRDLNGLRVIRKLGAGGMGEVWLAHDEDLDIQVAVKVLPPHLAADPGFVLRFLREA